MTKKPAKNLPFTTHTIRQLQTDELAHVVGGSLSLEPSGGITSINPSGGITSINPSGGITSISRR